VSLGQRLFPVGETRLGVVLGLTGAITVIGSAFSTSMTAALLNNASQAFWAPNVVQSALTLLLPVVSWILVAVGAFLVARRERAVFGYLAGTIAIACGYSALSLLLPGQPQPAEFQAMVASARQAPLLNGVVALAVVCIVALFLLRVPPTSVAGGPEADRHPFGNRLASALGLDPSHDPVARSLVGWALALLAVASSVGFGLAWLGIRGWAADIVRAAALLVSVYAAIRWRRAPNTLWLPGMVTSLVAAFVSLGLAVAGYLAGPSTYGGGPAQGLARWMAVLRATVISSTQHFGVLVVQAALMIVVVLLASRRSESLAEPTSEAAADAGDRSVATPN
jgi:hypothetical protein